MKCKRIGAEENADFREASDIEDPLLNMYEELGERFEEKLLRVATRYISSEEDYDGQDPLSSESVEVLTSEGHTLTMPYQTSRSYSILISIDCKELEKWRIGYSQDSHFSKILKSKR